jgi:PPM family protein phosphatase
VTERGPVLGRSAVATDTGRRRRRNEDAYVCEPPLFAIADGMGGARAGEIAAGLAAAALEGAGDDTRGETGLEAIIADANRRIWERSVADPATTGMGTTVTIALVDATAGRVVFGHVGDSRAYRLRDDELEQITTDHSLVAELVESGILTPEEAEHHPQRSAITRALGTEPDVEADVFTVDADPGDLYLICSDGLSDMLTEEEIAAAIGSAERDPVAAGEALVAAANANGGEDNITVVLFELLDDADPFGEKIGVETGPAEVGLKPDPGEQVAGEPAETESESLRRHGAGKGGRLAAILLVLAVLALGILVLYWGISR